LSRSLITTISFPVLLLLYFLYGWVVVPIVLPDKAAEQTPDIDIQVHDDLQPFLSLFKSTDWERDSRLRPKLLKNGNIIILFQEETIEDDTVRLQPCTFLVLPEDENLTIEEQSRRAVVLRADEMAEIKFAESVNFSNFALPKMIGGRLLGRVTIASGMKEEGVQDDMFIETSDIEIAESPTETLIYAVKDNIKFRIGYNTGEGARMTISMKAKNVDKNQKAPKEFASLKFDTLKYLNLVFPEKDKSKIVTNTDPNNTNPNNNNQTNLATTTPAADLPHDKITTTFNTNTPTTDTTNSPQPNTNINLYPNPNPIANPNPLANSNTNSNLNPDSNPDSLLLSNVSVNPFTSAVDVGVATKFDINCQREFRFDADNRNGGWTAAFNGNVAVVRTNPDGTQDFLNGELLHINFQPEEENNVKNNKKPESKNSDDKKTHSDLANRKANANSGFAPDKLQPSKLEVFGKAGVPAQLRSPQGGGVVMDGDRILYDLKKNIAAIETALTDDPNIVAGASPQNPKKKPEASNYVKVSLQNRYIVQSEFGFLYNIGKDGEFGILNSSGRGQLNGLIGSDDNLKKLHLTWNIMQIASDPNNPKKILLDLRGGVTIDIEDLGKMTAEMLQLWCNIVDKPKNTTTDNDPNNNKITNKTNDKPANNISGGTLVPESAIALNKVHFENQNGTCDVQRLNIFFIQPQNTNNSLNTPTPSAQTNLVAIPHETTSEHPSMNHSQNYRFNNSKQINTNTIIPATTTANNQNLHRKNNIQLAQYTEQKQPPVAFMPYMPPVIQLPLPTNENANTNLNGQGIAKIAQGNPIAGSNYAASGNLGAGNLPIVDHTRTARVPLTGTNNAVGGGVPNTGINVTNNLVPIVPQPDIVSARRQNLLGFQPGNSHSVYAITGDQMEMSVLQNERTSQVQRLWIGGNVRIVEKTEVRSGDLIEITGEEVYIWNPSTLNTVIYIAGKDAREAIFTGKGAQIRAMHVYIFRAENVIKITGAGRLIADAKVKKNTVNATTVLNPTINELPMSTAQIENKNFEQNERKEGDSRILVQWNKEMYFDGSSISFQGVPDKNGNRVLALMEDREIRCNIMQILTNRYVSLFDDKSDATIKADRVGCAVDVVVKSEKFENGVRKSFDWAEFDAVEIRLETSEFFAKGPGLIRSTFIEGGNALAELENGGSQNKNKTNNTDAGRGFTELASINRNNFAGNKTDETKGRESLMFLCMWFYDHVQGTFTKSHKSAVMKGHIDAVLCPVAAWDERIERDQLNIATKRGYLLKCDELRMVQMPDPVQQSHNFAELTAIDNATIEGENRSLYGRAQIIKYNQAKSQVTLEGNELNNAKITTASQGTIPAQRIEYNIKTGNVKIINAKGFSAGQ
jgi:hypothetical protein